MIPEKQVTFDKNPQIAYLQRLVIINEFKSAIHYDAQKPGYFSGIELSISPIKQRAPVLFCESFPSGRRYADGWGGLEGDAVGQVHNSSLSQLPLIVRHAYSILAPC